MIDAAVIVLRGSFQFRIATNMEHPSKSPYCHISYAKKHDPSGTDRLSLIAGVGWTFTYGEAPFDRKVRLSKPVDLRNLLIDPWVDTHVTVVLIARDGKPVAFPSLHEPL